MFVNESTNSAAEMVASFANEDRLATLLATTTAGNVLGAANVAVGSGYWLRVPVFGWMTWAGQCLEENGVTPAWRSSKPTLNHSRTVRTRNSRAP